MKGIKHLIECHCTLKLYSGRDNQLYHKFPVYSKIEKSGKIIEKLAQCNNCNTIHRIYDYCKSDIIKSGKDKNNASLDLEDIIIQLPVKISNILRKYDVDISTWEEVLDIFDNNYWNNNIVLSRELIDQKYHVKILKILDEGKIKIESQVIEDSF
ncbi:MAG: hypothetical protein VW380_02020 [Candidatus Woesearchaeota archaeon]